MKSRVLFVALALAVYTLFGQTVSESHAPANIEAAIPSPPTTASVASLPPAIAALPTIPASRQSIQLAETLTRAGYGAASLPALDPRPSLAALPTVTPTREAKREGCDPAYPDAGTCIPPGPPFEQGCAITEERLFTVRAPDPQGLDHDGDEIGCEPITN